MSSMVTLWTAPAFTLTLNVPVWPPNVAERTAGSAAVVGARARTRPALEPEAITEAFAGRDDDQVAIAVTSCAGEPSLNVAVAAHCCERPTGMLGSKPAM